MEETKKQKTRKDKVKRILFSCMIAWVFLSSLYIVSTSSTSSTKNTTAITENQTIIESTSHFCKDTGLAMRCNALSKVNKKGTQTRCYVYSKEFSYKVCDSGWKKQ